MRIGIADTTFARVDMGGIALEVIQRARKIHVERYTVPGFKDLPVAAKILIEKYKCDLVIALAWVGSAAIDELCAHEANIGLIHAELMTNKHILKVFVHAKEARSKEKLRAIATDRVQKHALNALALLRGKESLTRFAGQGLRQGGPDRGGL